MQILTYVQSSLEDIIVQHVDALSELDFATGKFSCVISPDEPSCTPSVPVLLFKNMIVSYFSPKPSASGEVSILSHALSLLYQRNWTNILMHYALRPLEFRLSDNDYFSEIANRAREATRARYCIIRLYMNVQGSEDLRCVAACDGKEIFPSDVSTYDLDEGNPLRQIYDRVESDFRAKGEYILLLRRLENIEQFAAMQITGSSTIQTIIISPLTVSDKVKGFINIGYDIDVTLGNSMKSAFATMFNHMSMAIENYQNVTQISILQDTRLNEFVERFHLDLMQGLRHSGHNALFLADAARERMLRYYSYKGDAKLDPAVELERAHVEIELTFENMASLKHISEMKEDADIVEVFNDAKTLLARKLQEQDVSVRVNTFGGPMKLSINKDAIRSAFANLLLNSIQAFGGANTKKADRKITVNFKRDAAVLVVDFLDEGPGVRVPAGSIRDVRDIWIPGKTSKKDGTGYGLALVREVFQRIHNGSVDLRPTSKGLIFESF